MASAEQVRWHDAVGPWHGFPLAADAAVRHLHERHGLDLWLVTHVSGDDQVVVAAAGPWVALARPAAVFPWATSFCRQMVARGGSVVEPDVRTSAHASLAVGDLSRVQAYVGVPLVGDDGQLFGSLCGYHGAPLASADGITASVELLGRVLSTVLRGEQVALQRSEDAATAYALAERDRLTGLRNRRGWEASLDSEQSRVRRYGYAVSLLALDIDDLKVRNDTGGHAAGDAALVACARALQETSRPGDVAARVGGDEFGLLGVECDARCAQALAVRLRVRMRSAGLSVSVGRATRRLDEDLSSTWRRADEAMYQVKRRHRQRAAAGSRAPVR